MKNWKGRSNIAIHQMDCLEAMKDMEDNAFDLAIVDPPYGIGADGTQGFATKKTKGFTFDKKSTLKRIGIMKYRQVNIFLRCKEYLKIKSFGVLITL